MNNSLHKFALHIDRPNVVGVCHSNEQPVGPDEIKDLDAMEFRLDLLGRLPSVKEVGAKPAVITARHIAEGGSRNISNNQRLKLLADAIGIADFVDLELQFWGELTGIMQLAREKGDVGIIASFHDFSATPALSELLEKAFLAKQLGADILKVATFLCGPADFASLLELLNKPPLPIAVMGMGPLGNVSRLALACCGSVLNYGWLGSPLVPGQWLANKFIKRFRELQAFSRYNSLEGAF